MLRYNVIIGLLCIGLGGVNAQKLEKKHTEKFNVNKDVVIDVNTRYTDIEIETWDKNEVVIEAYIDVINETDQKAIDDYLKKWNFEAMGNKSSIKISSKSLGLIDILKCQKFLKYQSFQSCHHCQKALQNLIFQLIEMIKLI